MKTLLRVSAGLAVLVAAGGCVVPPERNAGVSQPPPTAAVLPPNYEASEGEFVGVKLSQLAPEFLDEQAGKYIVFEGRFLYSHQGALLMEVVPRPLSLTDMMTLSVGGPDIMSARSVNVIYSVKDREMGRQFLEWSVNSPIKVYGYVLPANAQAKPKSGNNMRFGGIPVPTILLIKAVARPAA